MERRKLTRRVGTVAALLAVMALAACDTQPATDVTSNAATLNAKGKCDSGGYGGTNQYQLRNVSDGGAFGDVGPRFRFDCTQATGEVNLNSHRAGGLADGKLYHYRLVTRLDNGSVQTWDANGTNGGTNYDWFYTPMVLSETATQSSTWGTRDPDTGEVFPIAEAAGACSRRPKEVKRDATLKAWTGITIGHTHLMAPWKFCNGQITRMYPADATCNVTGFAGTLGWSCNRPEKVRAYSTGGNPEHAVYTYRFRFERWIPVKGVLANVQNRVWYSTIQISGSGAWFTHGSSEIWSWNGIFD